MCVQVEKTVSGECYAMTSIAHVQCAVVCWYSEDPVMIEGNAAGVVQARRAVSFMRLHQVVQGHIKWCELSSGGYDIVDEGHRCS